MGIHFLNIIPSMESCFRWCKDTFNLTTIIMILHKLSEVEKLISEDQELVSAINSVRPLLDKIDHDAEKVPLNNKEKLIEILTYLKQDDLNQSEIKLVSYIVKYD